MIAHPERTSREWFERAAHVHVEEHQACAWCGERYQVYKGRRGNRMEYYCPACDFYVFHDQVTGQYFAAPGRQRGLQHQSAPNPVVQPE
jgi:hypothetical protein